MREIQRDIVSAMIFSKDGKLLLGKKDPSKGGVYNDCWHIPGGAMDEDEERIDTLKREVFEETGIKTDNEEIIPIKEELKGVSEKTLDTGEKVLCHMNFFAFRVNVSGSSSEVNLVPNDDLIELKWVGLDELKDIKLTPPSVELFTKLNYLNQ